MSRVWIKATNENMGLIGPGSWIDTTWTIRYDGTISIISKYIGKGEFNFGYKIIGSENRLSPSKMDELKQSINSISEWIKDVDFNSGIFFGVCDGATWSLKVYDKTSGRILFNYDSIYTYGVPVLNKFEDLLESFQNDFSESMSDKITD